MELKPEPDSRGLDPAIHVDVAVSMQPAISMRW